MGKERLFRFKEFAVSHARSAMPVGMDGVLTGAWCDVEGVRKVLDAGCGCGLIALMCAQRAAGAEVLAIDVHADSVAEAAANFSASPWSDRLRAELSAFGDMSDGSYDLIVSNPPFFHSGVASPARSARLAARHADTFGPLQLLVHGAGLLSSQGRISLICPAEDEESLLRATAACGLHPARICRVSSRRGCAPIRVMYEASRREGACDVGHLAIHGADGDFTPEYKALTRAFYLKF